MYKGYETPRYDVIESDGAIEVRRHAPHLVAEISVAGSRQRSVARGFRALAGYISGRNATGSKLAMTAPVAQMPTDLGRDPRTWRVRFMMPSESDRSELPAPRDEAIRFVEVPPGMEAVIRFSGFWTDRKLAEKAGQLRAWAKGRGLSLEAPPSYYFYDDPFTLPFRRRNEIGYAIR